VTEAKAVLAGNGKAGRLPELWDGKASERVAAVLSRWSTTH
jgi:UDP-N-acetylglucosamine 2-epimerase (non-hydrolysing)